MSLTSTNSTATNARASATLSIVVRKSFGDAFLLDAAFAIPPGIAILFGPSGAGKTTLLDCVAGLLGPDAGRIAIGERVLFDPTQRIDVPVQRRRVGYVFQKLALFPHLSVERNVGYGLAHMDAAGRKRRVAAILGAFRISHLARRRPSEISGGEQQRVALARALVADPCILLLDEPLAALDAPTRSRLIDDLRAWNDAHRVPVLYVTHSREEVFALGERVIVLEQGRVLAQGSPQEVLESPRHETTAELAGVENVFDGVVVALHEAQGMMTCRLLDPSARKPRALGAPLDAVGGGAVQLEMPLARLEPGAPVRVAVRAGDILLATSPPQGLSARNVVPGRVVAVTRRDVSVIAQVECGVLFEVHVTPAAEEALALAPGREVWIIVKAHSCHLLRRKDL